MPTRTSVLLGLFAVLWLSALKAVAQEPAPQADSAATQAAHEAEQERAMQASDAEARQHFNVGKALLDAGRFHEAAQEFEAAYRLSQRPQLLYNLYIAHRDSGNTTRAVEALRAYLAQVPDAPDRVNLTARLEALEAQVRERQEQEARTAKARAEAEAAKAEAAKRTVKVVDKSIVPWILMGSGGALVVTSIGTGVAALKVSTKLEDKCFNDEACPVAQQDNIDKNRKLSLTTDVLWGTGAALAVTGFVLWVTGAMDTERYVPASSITKDGFTAGLTGRF